MLRIILLIIIVYLLYKYISAALKSGERKESRVKGKPSTRNLNIPEDRIQDANYKDMPDK